MNTGKHVVFYDGACGFCDSIVQALIKVDKKGIFLFAPLQGITAAEKLQPLGDTVCSADSLVLIENYNQPNESLLLYGKGALRILWLLGGTWALPGILSFMPGFLYNWLYYLVAKVRRKLMKAPQCIVPQAHQKERYLP